MKDCVCFVKQQLKSVTEDKKDILLHYPHMSYIVCLFDLILYVPLTIFKLKRDGSSWVEPVLS